MGANSRIPPATARQWVSPRSNLTLTIRRHSLLSPLHSHLAFGRSAASGLPCAGAPPPQRPLQQHASSTWCRFLKQVPNRRSFAFPRPASPNKPPKGQVLCLPWAPKSTDLPVGSGFGACPLSLQKAIDNSSPRWHDFPARLIPPQIWNAPQKTVEQTRFPCFIDQC